MFSHLQTIGNIGERWVYDQLKKRGYDVLVIPNYQAACADLRIGILPIEVKYARKSRRRKINKRTGEIRWYQRWQWNVSQLDDKDRVLFLIAEDDRGIKHPFIMPGSTMATRRNFQISRHPTQYTGLIAGYLDAWCTVDFMLKQLYYDDRQLSIYHMLTDEVGEMAK